MQYELRSQTVQSRRFHERKKTRSALFAAASLVVAMVIALALSFLCNVKFLAINKIDVIGVDSATGEKVQAAAENAISGKYLWLFNKSNIFIYPTSKVEEYARSVSSKFDSVSASLSGKNSLQVSIRERVPAALVCASLPDAAEDYLNYDDSSGSCYFADSTGYLFAKAPSFSGQVYRRFYFPLLSDSAGTTTDISGQMATSSAAFGKFLELYDSVKSSGIPLQAILLKDQGEYELYASNGDVGDMTVIYMNDARPVDDELVNLVSFWKGMNGKRFDYIDVRYGSNVFYREL